MNKLIPPTLAFFPALILMLAGAAGCEQKAKSVTGTVTLSPELQKTLQPTAVLYLIARKPGQTAGPPVAVKRFPQPISFPVEYTLSAQDAMMPDTPFEGNLAITARVSQSGAATPVSPGDIEGASTEVAVGAQDVEIKLTQVR